MCSCWLGPPFGCDYLWKIIKCGAEGGSSRSCEAQRSPLDSPFLGTPYAVQEGRIVIWCLVYIWDFFCSYNYDGWDFGVGAVVLFGEAVDYKAILKTGVENILQGTVIVTMFLGLAFNCFAVVAVWCQVFFC